MSRMSLCAGAVLAMVLTNGLALAQATGPRDPNMPDPKNVPAEKIKPEMPLSTGTPGSTLSERLHTSDGVLRPQGDPDPGMVVKPPVPNPGTTPVIPPPGSPGGNPRLDPK